MPKPQPKKQPPPKKQPVRQLRSPASDGYTKPVGPDHPISTNKLFDDLLRTFYYTFKGYSGPHPWGSWARPPGTESRPLKVVNPNDAAGFRKLIEQHLNSPNVRQRFLRTLWELRVLLRKVDTRVPPAKRIRVPYE